MVVRAIQRARPQRRTTMNTQARGIVVGFDGSPGAEAALDWAARTAQRQGRPLTVLHTSNLAAAVPGTGYVPDVVSDTLAEAAAATLNAGVERAAAVLDRSQITGTTTIGGPAAELVAASEGADLVVTGCRARGRLASGLLGSVAYAVTAHAKCPAVVVRGQDAAYPDATHDVVVGVDDSDASDRALGVAADIAAEAGAPLHIVRVEPLHVPDSWASVETRHAGSEHTHALRAEAEATLERAEKHARASHPDLAIETEILYGEAGHALAPLGDRAGLIVVGSRGRGGFAGLLLGSVSHIVIHEANCPVMVVR
jgi:nucleotide-binding universal stress UspA family protein